MAITISRPTKSQVNPTRLRNFPAQLPGVGLSVTRIVVAFLFACHGAQSLFGMFGATRAVAVGSWPGWWAAVIELVGGLLVLLGLFTRPAAILCSGAMAYAYFVVHQPAALLPLQNKGELSALYSWIFVLIAILGPGTIALDVVLRRRARTSTPS